MAKNGVKTSKHIARIASNKLKDEDDKNIQKMAGSALCNAKKNTKKKK